MTFSNLPQQLAKSQCQPQDQQTLQSNARSQTMTDKSDAFIIKASYYLKLRFGCQNLIRHARNCSFSQPKVLGEHP